MPREDAAAKARRYLTEGRALVLYVDGDEITASVRGDGRIWTVTHTPDKGWHCNRLARTDACSHLRTVRLVCVVGLEH